MKRHLIAPLLLAVFVLTGAVAQYTLVGNIPGRAYAPGQLIIKYKPNLNASDIRDSQCRSGVASLRSYSGGIHLVSISNQTDVMTAIAQLSANPDIEYAEPNYIRKVMAIPNDPSFGNQWALNGTVTGIHAIQAWNITTGSRDIKIAVIDTGVDSNHPDLNGNIWTDPATGYNGKDFLENDAVIADSYGHGTLVAGVMAAQGNNGVGIAGVSWASTIMPLRVGDAFGNIYISDAIEAVDYAIANGARIINASYGSYNWSNSEQDSISRANDAGILFIAAAGNDGNNNDSRPFYPASYVLPNIISVAASNSADSLDSWSNYGPNSVHVAAPGDTVYTTSAARRTLYSCNFDDGSAPGWDLNGWMVSSNQSYSSPYSLTNATAGGQYPNNRVSEAVSPDIDLGAAFGCKLEFMIYGSSEKDRDLLSVQVADASGNFTTCTVLLNNTEYQSISGSTTANWYHAIIDLGNFDGSGPVV